MSDLFIWLKNVDDVESVAEAVNRTPADIYEIVKGNSFTHKVSIFHIPTGTHTEVSIENTLAYPKEAVEMMFLDRLYEQAIIEWKDPWVHVENEGEYTHFHISAMIDGERFHQRVNELTTDVQNVEQYRAVLNMLVFTVDKQVKAKRYGTRN